MKFKKYIFFLLALFSSHSNLPAQKSDSLSIELVHLSEDSKKLSTELIQNTWTLYLLSPVFCGEKKLQLNNKNFPICEKDESTKIINSISNILSTRFSKESYPLCQNLLFQFLTGENGSDEELRLTPTNLALQTKGTLFSSPKRIVSIAREKK
ncbi:hypothetical protein HYV11_00025 [Candidatus Dependentiae bacterium]|nr:hypothetical protein [Candidatus Dependentiae bacterium]